MSFTWLTAVWAWVSGLSWVTKAAGLAGVATPLLAWFNPVLAGLQIVWTGIKAVVSWLFQGLEICVTHPVVLSVVIASGFAGAWLEHRLDMRLIESYKIEAQNVAKKVKGAADVETQTIKSAVAAGDAAEKEAKKIAADAQAKIFLPLVEPNATIATDHPVKAAAPPLALDPGPTAAELRNTKRVRRAAARSCEALFCVP